MGVTVNVYDELKSLTDILGGSILSLLVDVFLYYL